MYCIIPKKANSTNFVLLLQREQNCVISIKLLLDNNKNKKKKNINNVIAMCHQCKIDLLISK